MLKPVPGVALLLASYLGIYVPPTCAQDPGAVTGSSHTQDPLQVNWIYGAYVPKNDPLLPLTGSQRLKLYARQTFTTPGIYVKTGLFSAADQILDSPPNWDRDLEGFGLRVASRHGQFMIQNSLAALGNAALRYEPRYDRCRCSGFWPRTQHAVLRNFVTYDHSETAKRPQFASYGAALAAGAVSSLWKPDGDAWDEGYRSMITQAGFGTAANLLSEFAPEIIRIIRGSHDISGR